MARLGGFNCGFLVLLLICLSVYLLLFLISKAEELPSALLVGHAALLSSNKNARRRAAFWYTTAASRLEKCGIVSDTYLPRG